MEKVTITVEIERDLLEEARQLEISMPVAVEAAVRCSIADEKARRWREENAEAIKANNARIERDGLWCDDYRVF